jgi:predicted P-loop ATPase
LAEAERNKRLSTDAWEDDVMAIVSGLEIDEFKAMTAAEAKSTELGAKIAKEKEDTEFKQELEGTRMGVDIARSKEKSLLEAAKLMKEQTKKGD